MIQSLIDALHYNFSLKHLGSINYFLGLEAHISPCSLTLTQTKYAKDILLEANLSHSKPCPTPLCSNIKLSTNDSPPFEQPSLYHNILGALQYLTPTRPNMSFCVNKLSQFLQSPTQNHWRACKRVVRYIQGTLSHGTIFTHFWFQVACFCWC